MTNVNDGAYRHFARCQVLHYGANGRTLEQPDEVRRGHDFDCDVPEASSRHFRRNSHLLFAEQAGYQMPVAVHHAARAVPKLPQRISSREISMIRAYLYLFAAGVIWLVEGFLFSRYLYLAIWQTAVLAILYVVLFGIAVSILMKSLRQQTRGPEGVPPWRLLAYAPVLVTIVGSFVSLPLILLVVALSKL